MGLFNEIYIFVSFCLFLFFLKWRLYCQKTKKLNSRLPQNLLRLSSYGPSLLAIFFSCKNVIKNVNERLVGMLVVAKKTELTQK